MGAKPHHLGHRQRLRERFLKGGASSVADYELLELLLFGANPRQDVKPLAKQLLDECGSLAAVLNEDPAKLAKIPGMGSSAISIIKAVQIAAHRMLKTLAMDRPVMSSWEHVLNYCQASMGSLKQEQLRLLFLDQKNQMIADEVQQTGTVNHTPVYPREIVKRALDLGATGLILVHNHPSGDPTPSQADIDITRRIREAAEKLTIHVHDHIIVGKGRYISFKAEGLL